MSYLKSLISLRWIAAMMVAGALVSCAEPYGLQRVDHKVWRSSQPEKEQVAEMEEAGIKEVLNLRSYHSDDELAGHLKCHHVRMDAGNLNDESMFQALSILVNAKEPIVVHCWHGADRTGAVVALYRMVVHRWPRKMAIDEMMKPEFGHHADTFPNVRGYLENVDIVAMRRRLNLSGIDSGPAGIRNPLSPAAR